MFNDILPDDILPNTSEYLLFSSVGTNNKINLWLKSEDRLFDTVLCYYDDNDAYYNTLLLTESHNVYSYRRVGLKWPNFYNMIINNNTNKYKYIWVLDDDIEITTDAINRMFLMMSYNPNIMIAGPSTTYDSAKYHDNNGENISRIDNHIHGVKIRYTNYVEGGMMMINTKMLKDNFFMKLLSLANTGYYFDISVQKCFDIHTLRTSIAIFHSIIVRHPPRNRENKSELDMKIPRHTHSHDIIKYINHGIDILQDWDIYYYSFVDVKNNHIMY